MSRVRSIGVVIPAHDEADHVADAVGAVLGSLDHLAAAVGRASHRSTIVVVADSCRDDTASIARAVLGDRGAVVEIDARCVGTARAVGTAAALERLGASPDTVWLANTDADSVVPTTWIERQVELSDAGAECVAGVIALTDGIGQLRAAFVAAYSEGVELHRHLHVHGANLGIRADLLLRIGGWAPLATGEDHDLWRRAGTAGAQCVADPALVVPTSSRLLGRAPAGFARDLRALVV